MTRPLPEPSPPAIGRPLRLLDLVGFVAGFGLASLLIRTLWPRFLETTGPPTMALGLEFLWLGVAMSGPIILGLTPRRPSATMTPPSRPDRPGRLIAEVAIVPRHAPQLPPSDPARDRYSRAELAWLAIGSYWIALTFFVVPARATDAPWTLAGLVPVVGAFLILMILPRRPQSAESSPRLGWPHHVAVGLLWTWPIAWGLLVLLSRTF